MGNAQAVAEQHAGGCRARQNKRFSKLYLQYWNELNAHVDVTPDQLEAMRHLLYSYEELAAELLKRKQYEEWVKLQMAAESSPLTVNRSLLKEIEAERNDLLVPFIIKALTDISKRRNGKVIGKRCANRLRCACTMNGKGKRAVRSIREQARSEYVRAPFEKNWKDEFAHIHRLFIRIHIHVRWSSTPAPSGCAKSRKAYAGMRSFVVSEHEPWFTSTFIRTETVAVGPAIVFAGNFGQ